MPSPLIFQPDATANLARSGREGSLRSLSRIVRAAIFSEKDLGGDVANGGGCEGDGGSMILEGAVGTAIFAVGAGGAQILISVEAGATDAHVGVGGGGGAWAIGMFGGASIKSILEW